MRLKPVCASLLLVMPVLAVAIAGCDADENNYAESASINSATQATEIDARFTQPNYQSTDNPYGAEAFYQQLLAEYGANYQECLEPVAVNLDAVTNSDKQQQPSALRQQNLIFVLDASDSMTAFAGSSKTKFDLAKAAIARFASTFPDTTQGGASVFGNRHADTTTDPTAACAASESIYSTAQLGNLNLGRAIDPVATTSYKPISATLSRLGDILASRNSATNQNIIYLITDGTDNCNGNPVEVARELHNSEAEIIVNVIGLDENEAIRQQLQAIAEAGGGEYFLARDANEFNTAFESTKQNAEAEKSTTVQLEERTQASTSSTPNINQIAACTTVKMNRELGQIIGKINQLSTLHKTNFNYNNHVLTRLKERQDRIAAWRDRLSISVSDRASSDLNLFRQELAKASQ